MSSPTKSQAFREEGNQFYRQTQVDGIPPVIQRERLKKAMVCYRQALDTSVNSMEKSSALKNMSLTSMKLFTILPHVGEHISLTDYYLKEGIKSIDLALNLGQSGGQTQQWNNALYERYMENIDLVFCHLSSKKTKDRCHALENIASTINNKQVRCLILRETARVYFNSSVVALEAGDFKLCLSLLRDCHHPLEEAKLCNTDDDDINNDDGDNDCDISDDDDDSWEIVEEEEDDEDADDAHWSSPNDIDMEDITDLETSVFIQQCRAESLQARELGDALLKKSIRDSEDLNMDAVYTVIDFYKKAILLTKEIEVEMEAIALSRLGNLYDCILKDQSRAKNNYMRSLQLAGSLHPKVFHHEEWFKLAANATARYQNEYVEKEEQERAKERAPYLTEIKKELAEIRTYEEKGAVPLLEYIYKMWPPKNKDNQLTKLTTDPQIQKQALKKAIVHYHPDKQDVKLHGMKWFVLAEEITKILTRKYEYFKG